MCVSFSTPPPYYHHLLTELSKVYTFKRSSYCCTLRFHAHSIPFQGKETADHRYQGWATGLGISYGYSWILGKRWNIEATIGFGYAYSNYDKYDCATCGRFKGSQDKHYFGPTKAGISLIYIIK